MSPPKSSGKVCTNKTSTTFDTDDGGKYEQYYRYGSAEWQQAHSYGRQVIESYNASLKEGSYGGVGDPARRRLRGTVAQAFLTLLGVVATNARRIHAWLDEHYTDGEVAPPAVERRSATPRQSEVRPRASRKGIPASRRVRYGLPTDSPPGKRELALV